MKRWSFPLLFALLIGLTLQADVGATAKKKKKPDPNKELVVNGELTDQDDKDKVRMQSYCKVFTFKMVKGKTYQIDMKSKDFDSYLRLENPAGKEVAHDDDGGGFPDAKLVYKAAESGDFTIVATTFGGGVGKFNLVVKDKNAVGGIALKFEKGEATYTGNLDKDDGMYKNKRHKLLTVSLEEGKTYQIDMKSGAFDSYLFLEGPDGTLLAMDDDGGGFPDARITHKAAKAGTYRIVCTYFGGAGMGEFSVTVGTSDDKDK